MRKTRIEILLIGLTVLALSAGVVAGMLASRMPGSEPTAAPVDRTPLVEELGLTPDQRDQMRQIWEGVRAKVHQTFEDAQQLQKQRDDTLVSLLTDEQKAKFQKISKDYAKRYDQLARTRELTFNQAVERTKALLSEQQKRKYEEILKSRVQSAGPGGLGPPISRPVQ